MRREDQRGGNGSVPGTRRKAVPIAHELCNEIDCDQALDFWNQTGKIECILLCRHSRLKDETDERSRIKCGRDLRPVLATWYICSEQGILRSERPGRKGE